MTDQVAAFIDGLPKADFYDLAMASFRTAYAQHVVYAEVFFDPQAHTLDRLRH